MNGRLTFSTSLFPFSSYIPLDVALLYRLALVVFLFSTGDRQSDLQLSSLIIHRNRHYCQSFLGFGRRQFLNLFSGEEESARAPFVVALRRVLLLIRRNGDVHKIRLITAPDHISAFERPKLLPERFHLKAQKLDAGIELFQKLIVKSRFAVLEQHGDMVAAFGLLFSKKISCQSGTAAF